MPISAPPEAVLDIFLAASTQVTRRIEIYESDAVTLWMAPEDSKRIVTGTIGVSNGGTDAKRTLDLELDNTDNALRSDPINGLWYDKIIKVYRGVQKGIVNWECQIGEFMIDRLDTTNFPHTKKITGRDYTKKCLLSKFTASTTFTSGMAVETLIGNIAANAGITKVILPTTGKITGADITFDRGTDRWTAMSTIATSYGFEIFFDATGYLIMREPLDPLLGSIDFSFLTGAKGSLVSATKSANDTELYNHILVTGDSSDTTVPAVAAEAFNTETTSPTNIGRIGDRLYQYSSSFITTVDQAQDTATKFLKIYAQEQFSMDFGSICFPWLDAGSIVLINYDPEEPETDDNPQRFLLDSLSIPLSPEAMTGTGKRVTLISDDGSDQGTLQASAANRFVITPVGV